MSSPPHPVLEITLLTSTPTSTPSSILTQLQNVRTLLADKVLPTHSKFYTSRDNNEIYIIGFWPDLKSHMDFLADEKLGDEILGPQRDVLQWKWTGHVELGDGSVDDVRRGLEGLKVIEITKWVVEVSGKDTFLDDLSRLESVGVEESPGIVVAEGWGADSEANLGGGKTEYIKIRGWLDVGVIETVWRIQQDSFREVSATHHNAHGIYFDME